MRVFLHLTNTTHTTMVNKINVVLFLAKYAGVVHYTRMNYLQTNTIQFLAQIALTRYPTCILYERA